MATYTAKSINVSFNGVDLPKYFNANSVHEAIDRATVKAADKIMEAAIRGPADAFIPSCLWRRNLDGGAWRKRGHVAHRR
ncbi:hypothetical protein [Caldilinea sp.]|uniref:hypothetical protein n=1 Tax=Caldilinea sp. TaxID=2293560 RepID=UPI002C2BEA33|nr:hypothetical protein [Caldilinea sp.]